jgi:hypothetical protein
METPTATGNTIALMRSSSPSLETTRQVRRHIVLRASAG